MREDTAAENDLVSVGYRDRLFTELAANAADAAAELDSTPGRIGVWRNGRELHVANTGAPLDVDGVRSLTALRVSAKQSVSHTSEEGLVVGRFGVGFSATAAVADRVEIRSSGGGIRFDRAATAEAVGVDEVPLLRLAWPVVEPPAAGFDTEVVLSLTSDVDAAPLLADIAAQVDDLLLELPALQQITVAGRDTSIVWSSTPDGLGERAVLTTASAGGVATATVVEWLVARGPHAAWMVPVADNAPVPVVADVLRAPTPTDIELSLPARCVADIPLLPDRRGLHPDADIADAAVGYADLVRMVAPEYRTVLVPAGGLARNADDARLVAAVLTELEDGPWVPTVAEPGGDAASAAVRPARALLFPSLTDDLASVLAEVVDGLVPPELTAPHQVSALRRVGVTEIGLADIAEFVAAGDRPAQWWGRLYEALSPIVTGAGDVDELGALPVPRADGRRNIGARGLHLPEVEGIAARWIATPHPDATHPLLERLGATRISTGQMLDDPALRGLIDDMSATWEDGDVEEIDDPIGLAREVGALLAADPDNPVPSWVAGLLLPDTDGELAHADELLLPDSPLASVLVDDAPFGIVDADLVDELGAQTLRRMGVGWGFLVLSDDLPVAPDHELPDEEDWWGALGSPPESLVAVRDLDLVDDRRWPEALTLLADDPRCGPLLADRAGYTAWWLRHHAAVEGARLGTYRNPDDESLAGLLDPLPHARAGELAGVLAASVGERPDSAAPDSAAPDSVAPDSVADVQLLLDRLGDENRTVSAGVAVSAWAAVVEAIRSGLVDVDDLDVPQGIRTLDGSVAEDGVVIDGAWWIGVLPASVAVLPGLPVDAERAGVLADVLDLPLASEVIDAEVSAPGVPATWASVEAVAFAAARGIALGHGEIRIHDDLRVVIGADGTAVGERVAGEFAPAWWVDASGVTHLRAGEFRR